ncbi:hypothetical protein D3C71_22970 [compost metagenome]
MPATTPPTCARSLALSKRLPYRVSRQRQAGFSLPEVMVALTVITIISLFVIGALSPWLGLKQSIDNDRRLEDIRQGLVALYERQAMEAETNPGGRFFDFVTSSVDANRQCEPQLEAFAGLRSLISDAGAQAAKDGFSNAWCVFVSNNLSQDRDGTTLHYRTIAVVSTGRDGKLDEGTQMDNQGNMQFRGDDIGFVVNGYDIQYAKLRETLRRMSRVGNIYETYFSTRYMSYADRDITRYYFSRGPAGEPGYDNAGVVPSTASQWGPAATVLKEIGVSPDDAFTAWETTNGVKNAIEVGNYNESQNLVTARTPFSTGTGTLPYTALLRARIPSPTGELFVTRVVVGNY